jgi:hypothetical protein
VDECKPLAGGDRDGYPHQGRAMFPPRAQRNLFSVLWCTSVPAAHSPHPPPGPVHSLPCHRYSPYVFGLGARQLAVELTRERVSVQFHSRVRQLAVELTVELRRKQSARQEGGECGESVRAHHETTLSGIERAGGPCVLGQASANGDGRTRYKPATLETGAGVKVPAFVAWAYTRPPFRST